MKPGTRLRSAVCDGEVVIVRAPSGALPLQCGGRDMLAVDAGPRGVLRPLPRFEGGTQLGKRYADAAATVEVLCTKPGVGALSYGDELLEPRSARALPASD